MYCTCFFNVPAPTEIYTSCHTLSLHDALPIYRNSDGELWMVDTQNSAPPAPSERMPSNFCAAMKRSATMPMNSVDTIVAIPIRPNVVPMIVLKCSQIRRAHVLTPVTNSHIVCRLLLVSTHFIIFLYLLFLI